MLHTQSVSFCCRPHPTPTHPNHHHHHFSFLTEKVTFVPIWDRNHSPWRTIFVMIGLLASIESKKHVREARTCTRTHRGRGEGKKERQKRNGQYCYIRFHAATAENIVPWLSSRLPADAVTFDFRGNFERTLRR